MSKPVSAQTCEFCGATKPLEHWSSIEDGKDVFTVLMVEFIGCNGHTAWNCRECAADIVNKL